VLHFDLAKVAFQFIRFRYSYFSKNCVKNVHHRQCGKLLRKRPVTTFPSTIVFWILLFISINKNVWSLLKNQPVSWINIR